jgi:hypothetical protein
MKKQVGRTMTTAYLSRRVSDVAQSQEPAWGSAAIAPPLLPRNASTPCQSLRKEIARRGCDSPQLGATFDEPLHGVRRIPLEQMTIVALGYAWQAPRVSSIVGSMAGGGSA